MTTGKEKAEGGRQKAEIRGQRLEVRDQRAEGSDKKLTEGISGRFRRDRFVFSRLSPLASCLLLLFLAACATPGPKVWRPLQESDLAPPLTLEKCLRLAEANDLKLVQWQAKIDAARAELRGKKIPPNPTLVMSWEDVGMRDAAGASLAVFKYGLTYPIFFWWPRAKEIAAAQAKLRAEEQAVRHERRQLAVEIGSAYFNLVADQRKIRISDDLLQNAREEMRLVKKERELASASDYEVNRARAEELKAEKDLADAQNQLRLDQLAFAFALGADRPMFPQVADVGDSLSLPLFHGATTDSVPESHIAEALKSDPSWARTQAEREAAEAELQVQKRLAIPLSETRVGASRVKDPGGMAWDFTLEAPIPIFDRNQAGIWRAETALMLARADEEEARRASIASLAQVWERGRRAALLWSRFSREISQLQAKNQRAADKLFAAGQITYTDLLQVRREYNDARLAEVDVWKEAVTGHWALSCALGQHDPPAIGQPPKAPVRTHLGKWWKPPVLKSRGPENR